MQLNYNDTNDNYECIEFNSREDWLKARRNFIGASEASAVLNISPWQTARKLYDEKTSTEPIVSKGNSDTKRGSESESHIRELYAIEHNCSVIDGTNVMFVSRKYPWMHCSLDGIIIRKDSKPIILEIKSVRPNAMSKYRDWLSSDEPPEYYQVQVLHQLAVTGWEDAILLARIINPVTDVVTERKFFFNANGLQQEMLGLVEVERKFWHDHVLAKIPPKEVLPTI